jgi:hypothetical protein
MRKQDSVRIAMVRQSNPRTAIKGETGSATIVKIARGPESGKLMGQRCFR